MAKAGLLFLTDLIRTLNLRVRQPNQQTEMTLIIKKLKPLDRQSVRMAATMLMLAEGNTTTPRVKQYLQERGYRAGQSEVSSWLFRIATREGWIINENDSYRLYYFPNFTGILAPRLSK